MSIGFRAGRIGVLCLAASLWAPALRAETATVKDLGFYKSLNSLTAAPFQDANLVLKDSFDNGNPALSDPRVDGNFNSYSFHNLLPGVTPLEAGGQLTISADASHTFVTQSAAGQSFYSAGVRLLTNISDTSVISNGPLAGRHSGLSRDTAWSTFAAFVPTVPGDGANYGVRLSDFGIGDASHQGNDVLEIRLRTSGGITEVLFYRQDFVAGKITVFGRQTLAVTPDLPFIAFGFAHGTADTDTIEAFYAVQDNTGVSLGSAPIYSDENFTRFEMRVSQPVPEPASAALLLAGLAALAAVRQKPRARRSVCEGGSP